MSRLWPALVNITLAGALAASLSGCADEGEGALYGSLTIPECEPGERRVFECAEGASECRAFDLDPDFFSMDVTEDEAFIRIQHGAFYPPDVDGLFIQIRDRDALTVGAPMPIGTEDAVRVGMHLGETCPDGRQSLLFSGELVLSHFGTGSGDRVAGRIDPLIVTDGRDGEALGSLVVEFDFEYRLGTPHQPFTRR